MDVVQLLNEINWSPIFAGVAGAAASWWLTRRRYILDIKQIELELATARFHQEEKLWEKEKEYLRIEKEVEDKVIALLDAFDNPEKRAQFPQLWDEVRDLLFKGYLKTLHNYLTSHQILYRLDPKAKRRFIENRIILYLQTLRNFLLVINESLLLDLANENPVTLQQQDINPFWYYTLDNTPWYYFGSRMRVRNEIRRLLTENRRMLR